MTYLAPARQRYLQSLLWAMLMWLLLQLPFVQRSFVGAADVEALQLVLQLQKDNPVKPAAPAAFIDFTEEHWSQTAAWRPPVPEPPPSPTASVDPTLSPPAPPDPTPAAPPPDTTLLATPRLALAGIIDFLRTSAASAVLIDIDLGLQAEPHEEEALVAALDRWRADTSAPLLILTQQDFEKPSIFRRNDRPDPKPTEPIAFGSVVLFGDSSWMIRYFEYATCLPDNTLIPGAAVLLAAAARFDDPIATKRAVQEGLSNARCVRETKVNEDQLATLDPREIPRAEAANFRVKTPEGLWNFQGGSGPIRYQLSYDIVRKSPLTPAEWRATELTAGRAKPCNLPREPAAIRRPALDLLDGITGGVDASQLFCGAMVIVGSSAPIMRDNYLTPYDEMPGPLILANAARGLDMVGPLRRFPFVEGIFGVVILTSLLFGLFEGISRLSEKVLPRLFQPGSSPLLRWPVEMISHPLTLSVLTTQIVLLVGLLLVYFAVDVGYWGVFAAPTAAAALSNAFDSFNGMRRAIIAREANRGTKAT